MSIESAWCFALRNDIFVLKSIKRDRSAAEHIRVAVSHRNVSKYFARSGVVRLDLQHDLLNDLATPLDSQSKLDNILNQSARSIWSDFLDDSDSSFHFIALSLPFSSSTDYGISFQFTASNLFSWEFADVLGSNAGTYCSWRSSWQSHLDGFFFPSPKHV